MAQTMEAGQNRQVRGNNADKDTRTCPALIRANTYGASKATRLQRRLEAT